MALKLKGQEEAAMMALRLGSTARGRKRLFGVVASLATLARFSPAAEEVAKQRVADLGGGVKMSLVLIPAGTFTMGSTEAEIKAVQARMTQSKEDVPDHHEKPAHKVTISKDFYMGKHEVTVGQFRRFVEATRYRTDAEKDTESKGVFVNAGGEGKFAEDACWRNPYFKQTDDHPVVCVSWNDARAFMDWLNAIDKTRPPGWTYRLPAEAEWEYACRAGSTTWYQWGDDPDKGKGWCNGMDLTGKRAFPQANAFNWDDGYLTTAPVGSFKANGFRLHDMHGNVFEWCQDSYGRYVGGGGQTDPTGPVSDKDRVMRGGDWHCHPGNLRSAARAWLRPAFRFDWLGFRVVLSATPQ